MGVEGEIVFGKEVEFDYASAEKYKLAAKFMVQVAEQCFNLKMPREIADCWGDTLELMYYIDHVLDHIKTPYDRTQFMNYEVRER